MAFDEEESEMKKCNDTIRWLIIFEQKREVKEMKRFQSARANFTGWVKQTKDDETEKKNKEELTFRR